ncbi:MAG: hybrid sensor histidine kinase/response regulator [Verrucomicrobiales bacterium]|nr:hybrid sensor histidine kinase/response regulator [Verrucomicrobiales bacterium]
MNSLASPTRSRVLVVDDIPRNLQVVGTMLRGEGYEVMGATSGADALESVRAEVPDLILLDLMMPEMDGLEVCRRFKADPSVRGIPTIFLTASNEMEHLVRGFEAGAVDYITKPFNAPELLARVRTHLELRHARERLREMNDEKNEFMGIAAHDLRSPLNAVKGYTEMLIEEEAMDRSEQTGLLGRIHDATQRMVEMVQNLLDVNAIERGEMNLQLAPADVSALLSSAVETHRPRAAAKQQRLHLGNEAGPVNVRLDPNLTVQVLENLISNAVKYSPPGRDIHVRLKRSPGGVRCEVKDEGPGLSAEDQKKLFGKFARLSAKPTGGEHSTGLGLSIVKKMVEAMHGRVWCESELGHGATFIVEFAIAGGESPSR